MKTIGYIMLGLFILLVLAVFGFAMKTCSIAEKHVTDSMENAVISYDDYQDIYNTCNKLNDDLGVIRSTPPEDEQFSNFSKAERINSIKISLNRWINEYNAKSSHIDKKWWKSSDLPYHLTASDFSNY